MLKCYDWLLRCYYAVDEVFVRPEWLHRIAMWLLGSFRMIFWSLDTAKWH